MRGLIKDSLRNYKGNLQRQEEEEKSATHDPPDLNTGTLTPALQLLNRPYATNVNIRAFNSLII